MKDYLLPLSILVLALAVLTAPRPSRYDLLGVYKPKGFAIVFDSTTGDISTRSLPKSLLETSSS